MGATADKHYDLIILGTGSGNSIPSPEWDDKSIAIVEEGVFGGTCLNVGCIPTKMYVLAAETAQSVREGERLGVHAHVDRVDWPGIVDRVFAQRIDPIAAGGEKYRRGPETPNTDVYDGHAEFVGPHTLRTAQGGQTCTISGDNIVIAAGSRPTIPPVIANSGVTYRTNEDIMRLPRQPKDLIIVGGGFIAMEFAHVFSALGTTVTVINRSDRLLKHLDAEISERFTQLAADQWDIRFNSSITQLSSSDGRITATVEDSTGATTQVHADEILVATGRTPNADRLGLEAAGIALDGDRVGVDKYGRTTVAGVWALGDVSSPYMLKHVANAEARTIAHNLLHPDQLRELPHAHVPSAVFTHPQIATVGMTEKEAREQGHPVTTKVQAFGDVAYGWGLEDTTGVVKLIADRSTRRLLGAHIMGPQASTLIQEAITMMAFDIPVPQAARGQYWIHPALPEVIENALLGLDFDD